jgi:hypothetical protein
MFMWLNMRYSSKIREQPTGISGSNTVTAKTVKEKDSPVSAPVTAVFYPFFSFPYFLLPKRYTVGLYGIQCRS